MSTATHQQIIARANERGFFPTEKDAKKISELSASEYYKRVETGEVGRGRVDDNVLMQVTDWAIGVVMEGRQRFSHFFTGIADKAMVEAVKAAADTIEGKRIRITFEEI